MGRVVVLGGSHVRSAVIRLTVIVALVLSATALSPIATAATTPSPSPAVAPDTLIYAHPKKVGISGKPRFIYGSDRADVMFRCRLRGPGRENDRLKTCPQDAGDPKRGQLRYSGLKSSAGAYVFMVQAYIPATGDTPRINGPFRTFVFHKFTLTSPDHFSPRKGASFNRPLSPAYTKVNINKIIRTVNSMPGYKQATRSTCPWNPRLRPSSIRITLFSLTGHRLAKALVAAHRRCVSVQILMNNHLDRTNDPSWKVLEDAMGPKVYNGGHAKRSFAHRCSYGCRGSGVLHTKMFLFNSTAPSSRFNKITAMVTMGSSNMTFNATNIQYNDLFTVRGREDLYSTYLHQFNLMKRDNGVTRRLVQVKNGAYQTTFWPQDPGGPDPTMQALRSISCTGVTGGAGYRGRTMVHINMHAWFNERGLGLARQVRKLYNQGCYVRILYSFMSYGVYKQLHNGTGPRMSVRRTLFSHDGHHGYVYSHFKNILASGNVGGNTHARVVWTGSNNFTNGGTHYDEVMMRIPFTSVYNDYRNQFNYMQRRKSSAVWAIFQEPVGGGRAPRMMRPRAFDVPPAEAYDLPPNAPVVIAPPGTISFDQNGEPRALD